MPDSAAITPARVRSRIEEASRVVASLADDAEAIAALASRLRATIHAGGKVLTCGNGGSAAEAMHLAEELIGKYRAPRDPFPAICLNADPTALTCIANDFGYDEVFVRQTRALAKPGDLFVGFTTSGSSRNVLLALQAAKAAGATTVGMLGASKSPAGGEAAALCDHAIVVRSNDTGHIQEAHQVVIHLLLEALEPD